MSRDSIIEKAITLNSDRVIIIERWHEGFAKMNFFKISSSMRLLQIPPLIFISKIYLRREISKRAGHNLSSVITMDSECSFILEQTAGYFSKFFDLPILSLNKKVENHKFSMHFSINSKKCVQVTFVLLGRTVEIGPRLSVSQIIWKIAS
jgi:hypothetical protein